MRRVLAIPNRKISFLDFLAIFLLAIGLLGVAVGLLSVKDATDIVQRITPLLLFLAAVIVLAELAAKAEVFDVLASYIARVAKGSYHVLFLLCFLFATLTTTFLNLDTTAVLLTPVMIATANKIKAPPLALAMMTVWLANTASLLLPVSNLTSLLAVDRIALTTWEFATRMLAPQLAALFVTAICLWWFYWQGKYRNQPRYLIPPKHQPQDIVIFIVAAIACCLFVAGILLGITLAIVSVSCALLVVGIFVIKRPSQLNWQLLPWRLLVFVTGLFLVVQTISTLGLVDFLASAIGVRDDFVGMARAAYVGATTSNLINNLPAYVAGEAVVPLSNGDQLLALLIGTNIGPLVTPWASLAIILWHERCMANGVHISWKRFMATGLVTATASLAASVIVLALTA